jgi:hypothetical protein
MSVERPSIATSPAEEQEEQRNKTGEASEHGGPSIYVA